MFKWIVWLSLVVIAVLFKLTLSSISSSLFTFVIWHSVSQRSFFSPHICHRLKKHLRKYIRQLHRQSASSWCGEKIWQMPVAAVDRSQLDSWIAIPNPWISTLSTFSTAYLRLGWAVGQYEEPWRSRQLWHICHCGERRGESNQCLKSKCCPPSKYTKLSSISS